MFDWDDLRFFLAVAREGGLGAAAKTLGVDQSTVQRRLKGLEAAIGRQLLKRDANGYSLTDDGLHLLPHARHVEVAAHGFQRGNDALEVAAAGKVRVAAFVTVGQRIIKSGFIDRFHEMHPGIKIELLLGQRLLDLVRGEADMAIRGGAPGGDTLIAKRIADLPWAMFASKSYIARHGRPTSCDDLNGHKIVDLVDEIEQMPAARWLRERAAGAEVAARCCNIPSAHLAVKSGAGIAPLPAVYARTDEDLVCVLEPMPQHNYPMYLVVHKDMRKVKRVSAFFDYCASGLKPVLTGAHVTSDASLQSPVVPAGGNTR